MDRVQIKAQGKAAMQANYLMCIIVAIITTISSGGISFSVGFPIGRLNSSSSSSSAEDIPSEAIAAFFAIIGIMLVIFGIIFLVAAAINFLVVKPLDIGCRSFFLNNLNAPADINLIGLGYKMNYKRNVIAMLLSNIFIVLWSFLFIIPGIIATYSYRFVPYILSENPDIKPMDAIGLSKQMMNGHKWEAFVFDLSFLGWNLLGILTFGILNLVFVNPYYHSSSAAYYNAVKLQYSNSMGRMQSPEY